MFTVHDFLSKFESYSDEELMAVRNKPEGYSKEAVEAANSIIEKRGGEDAMLEDLEAKKIRQLEILRIKKEMNQLGKDGIDAEFMKKTTTSDILTEAEVHEIIDDQYAVVEHARSDEKITSKTIAGSILGGGIAAVAGGILWGISLIYSARIFTLLIVGLALFCYIIIRGITRQSKNNTAVLIATVLSTIAAIAIGFLLYRIVGYRE